MCSSSITSTESCMKCEYLLVNWSMLMTRGFFFFSFCCRVEYQLQWLLLNFSSWTNWVGDVLMFLLLIILFRKSAGCSSEVSLPLMHVRWVFIVCLLRYFVFVLVWFLSSAMLRSSAVRNAAWPEAGLCIRIVFAGLAFKEEGFEVCI
jgi:hypothetical protein